MSNSDLRSLISSDRVIENLLHATDHCRCKLIFDEYRTKNSEEKEVFFIALTMRLLLEIDKNKLKFSTEEA